MIQKKVDYIDFNGNERSEVLFFHMSKAECIEFLASNETFSDDFKTMVITIKDLILKSYGEASQDGKRFIKSEEKANAFYQSEAYSSLYMSLINSEKDMNEFINGVIPVDIAQSLNSK